MTLRWASLGLTAVLCSTSGCSRSSSSTTPEVDAGKWVDAGSVVDAGSTPVDAGRAPTPDAGPKVDAGPPPVPDAGPPLDAGIDAGFELDAGVDGGVAGCDAGGPGCLVCSPGSSTCATAPDGGQGLLICDSTGMTLDFDTCYPTQVCFVDGGVSSCEPFVCFPGQNQCATDDGGYADSYTTSGRQTCNATGTGWLPAPCPDDPSTGVPELCGFEPTGFEVAACVTTCEAAVLSANIAGCDFWGALLSNTHLPSAFTGGDADGGAGAGLSDFAFLVTNPGPWPAHLTVVPGSLAPVEATVAPQSSQAVFLPWLPICGTGEAVFGYHLTSDQPVQVVQFNPFHSSLAGLPPGTGDATRLLPIQTLGTTYVVASVPEVTEGPLGTAADPSLAGAFAIAATADGTEVQVAFAGASVSSEAEVTRGVCTRALGGVAAQDAGAVITYALSRGEVLQFWADNVGSPTCQTGLNGDFVCQYPNDLTGTVISSLTVPLSDGGLWAPPLAVISGADCANLPFNEQGCSHLEEELVPVNEWANEYVGVVVDPSTGPNPSSPDFFRLFSTGGPVEWPSGVTVTITPAVTVTQGQSACSSASGMTTCVLAPLAPNAPDSWIEIQATTSFDVGSDSPVSLIQYSSSRVLAAADGGSSMTSRPSMRGVPPISNWLSEYQVETQAGFPINELDLVAPSYGLTGILVDGAPVLASEWASIPGTTWEVAHLSVCGSGDAGCSGVHTVSADYPIGTQVWGEGPSAAYGFLGELAYPANHRYDRPTVPRP